MWVCVCALLYLFDVSFTYSLVWIVSNWKLFSVIRLWSSSVDHCKTLFGSRPGPANRRIWSSSISLILMVFSKEYFEKVNLKEIPFHMTFVVGEIINTNAHNGQTTKNMQPYNFGWMMLIRLRESSCWSVSLLLTLNKVRILQDVAQIKTNTTYTKITRITNNAIYSKTCRKLPEQPKLGFQDHLSLNAGQK